MKPVAAGVVLIGALLLAAAGPDSFTFVLIGDRTGEARPGVYERVWKDLAERKPAFVVSTGDTIEGLDDATAETQWAQVEKTLAAWRQFPLYLTPGNHDIWSERSEQLFRKYAGHPPHYSFDYLQAHFTILDNSRSDELSANELAYLEEDLKEHKSQPVKFIVSHRPAWILQVMIDDPNFRMHQIARKYGAGYVIAGHIHEMLHAELEGVQYVSMASAGGHLRASGKYQDGWFFGYALIEVSGKSAEMHIQELGAPFGQGRSTTLKDWGKAGLLN